MKEYDLKQCKLTSCLQDNISLFLEKILINDHTVRHRVFTNKSLSNEFCIIFIDGMVKNKIINDDIIAPLINLECNNIKEEDMFEYIEKSGTFICDAKVMEGVSEIVEGILYGDSLLLIDGYDKGIVIDTKGWESRSIFEPQGETVLYGPREGFTEAIIKNISLVKRRINNKDLKCELMKIGMNTNTKVALMYMDGIVEKEILDEVKKRLKEIEKYDIFSSGKILELIEDHPKSLFRQIGKTERPDVVAAKLLEGKVAILSDGSPIALTIPFLFSEYFSVNEDYYNSFAVASFYRLLRYFSFFLGSSVPAIYVAIMAYHREIIPIELEVSIFASRSGVPFSTFMECFFMLIIFEIIKEAGVRLPKYIGTAISIVGALVLGDAVVKARFISNPVVIIIAVTELASFTLTYMQGALVILRFILLFSASIMGMFGYLIGAIIISIYLVSMRSFGKEYMEDYLEFGEKAIKDTFVRFPWKSNLLKKENGDNEDEKA